jgi:diguanylate cyclase (GGDEF)-like protein
VMMPETDLGTAIKVAGRIADQLRGTVVAGSPPLQGLTVSIGATALQPGDAGLHVLIDRADQALYRAKEMGRDRIETAA